MPHVTLSNVVTIECANCLLKKTKWWISQVKKAGSFGYDKGTSDVKELLRQYQACMSDSKYNECKTERENALKAHDEAGKSLKLHPDKPVESMARIEGR